jgi:serine/threonine-protein kinase
LFDPKVIQKLAARNVGEVIGDRWDLRYLLDADVLSCCYMAVDRKSGGLFVMEILNPELAAQQKIASRFGESAKTANRVEAELAPAVIETGVTDAGVPFFVAGEVDDAETVAEYLLRRGRTIPPAEALRMIAEMLDVLHAAHEREIAHGSIEPRMLLLEEDGSVVIRGFGLSELRLDAAIELGLRLPPQSHNFLSPEQMKGAPPSPAGDIWSTGATLFALLTSQPVYAGLTDQEQYRNAALNRRRTLDQVERKAPEELVSTLERALAPDPEARFPAADLAAKLRQLAESPSLRSRRHLIDELGDATAAATLRPRPSQPALRPDSTRPPPSIRTPHGTRVSGAYSQVTPDTRSLSAPRIERVGPSKRPKPALPRTEPVRGGESSSPRKPNSKA